MPALTSFAVAAIRTVPRHVAALVQRLARALKNRRDARTLAGLDDHMLADIGLTRSDLHDAYSESLWRDPTDLLAQRVAERRGSRRLRSACARPFRPLMPAVESLCYPRADRPARYLM